MLTDLLRDEWGFNGLVMSDWRGTHSAGAVDAGLDLEMPGPPQFLGHRLEPGLASGESPRAAVDRAAGALWRSSSAPPPARTAWRSVATAREVARDGRRSDRAAAQRRRADSPLDANRSTPRGGDWRARPPRRPGQGGGSAEVAPDQSSPRSSPARAAWAMTSRSSTSPAAPARPAAAVDPALLLRTASRWPTSAIPISRASRWRAKLRPDARDVERPAGRRWPRLPGPFSGPARATFVPDRSAPVALRPGQRRPGAPVCRRPAGRRQLRAGAWRDLLRLRQPAGQRSDRPRSWDRRIASQSSSAPRSSSRPRACVSAPKPCCPMMRKTAPRPPPPPATSRSSSSATTGAGRAKVSIDRTWTCRVSRTH